MIKRLREISDGLVFKIAAMLAAAILPLGLIAVAQTVALIEETRIGSENNLLALTSQAAAGQEGQMRSAFGAAQAIASFVPTIRTNPERCVEVLSRFVESSAHYSFAGYVEPDGRMRCSSSRTDINIADTEYFKRMKADPAPLVALNTQPAVSQEPVIVIRLPILMADAFDGYVAVSIPHSRIFSSSPSIPAERPIDLITFGADGEILTADGGLETVEGRLPAGYELSSFIGNPQIAFSGENRNGEDRVFAVVPVVNDLVYALGSWEPVGVSLRAGAFQLAMPILLPALMWVASTLVAFFAIERLVIRPTRNLRARMLVFMRSRTITPPKDELTVPRELREIDETWYRLASNVVREAAELEDTIHDKNVLLKEVHHRVKNNLQLIASMLNMKIRKTADPEIKTALRDVQGRVLSLATVHRNLYETTLQGRVQADELLRAIVRHILAAGQDDSAAIDVVEHFDNATLYPDQAVPLSLAVSEGLGNALKYCGSVGGKRPRIEVRFKVIGAEAELSVENTMGDRPEGMTSGDSTGLGMQLIRAFSGQLGGDLETFETDHGTHKLVIRFTIAEFEGDALDGIA